MGLTNAIIEKLEDDRNLKYKLAIHLNVSLETIKNWIDAEKDDSLNVRRYPLRSEASIQFLMNETGFSKPEIISEKSEEAA